MAPRILDRRPRTSRHFRERPPADRLVEKSLKGHGEQIIDNLSCVFRHLQYRALKWLEWPLNTGAGKNRARVLRVIGKGEPPARPPSTVGDQPRRINQMGGAPCIRPMDLPPRAVNVAARAGRPVVKLDQLWACRRNTRELLAGRTGRCRNAVASRPGRAEGGPRRRHGRHRSDAGNARFRVSGR